MTPRDEKGAGVQEYHAVVNSTGRRFHVGTDEQEAIEVCTRLEAQARGVASASAVGGPAPTVADLPEHVVVTVKAPSREHVAEAIAQGVPLPGTPQGNVSGNEVAEREAAEARARGESAKVDKAFGVAADTPQRDREGTDLEPRPEPQPEVETFADIPKRGETAEAGVRERKAEPSKS